MRGTLLYELGSIQPILTWRGLALEGLLVYFLLGPVTHESDIVASVLSFSLLGIHIILATISYLKGRSLRTSLNLRILTNGQLVGGQDRDITLKISPFRLPPFFLLKAEIVFKEDGVDIPVVLLSGASSESSAVTESIQFPHRGIWEIAKISFELGDRLGLTAYSWNASEEELKQSCEVNLPPARITNLPVVSSSRRAGDLIPHPYDKLGDPFDLKQYHPSDGLKKLLWKVYARSGELVSRHPESTMTPEGRVAIYCIAERQDDLLSADCLQYAEELAAMDLELLLGCSGMNDKPLARTPEQFRKLLLESVWQSSLSSTHEIALYLSLCERELTGSTLDRVAVFCAAEHLDSEEGLEHYAEIGRCFSQKGIKPVFFIRGKSEGRSEVFARVDRSRDLLNSVLSFFFEQGSEPERGHRFLNKFLGICGGNHWEVVR